MLDWESFSLMGFIRLVLLSFIYFCNDFMNALIIGKSREKLFGTSCKDLVMNQRLVDQHQLPSEFLRLIGQKKIFHLWFGTRKSMLNTNNVLIYNVSEDSTIEPATPQNLLRDIAVSSITVLSSTSMRDTSAQSFKRNRESARRCLFASPEQRSFLS